MAGRPRNPHASGAILAAALAILRERGVAALTLDEVARRAGVGKSSVYARFPGRAELAAAALASLQREPPLATGELRADLIAYLRAVERDLGSIGTDGLGAPPGNGPSGAPERAWLIGPLARHGERLLRSASARGELRPEADTAAAAAVMVASLLVSRLVGDGGAAPWPERIVDTLLGGLAQRA